MFLWLTRRLYSREGEAPLERLLHPPVAPLPVPAATAVGATADAGRPAVAASCVPRSRTRSAMVLSHSFRCSSMKARASRSKL